MITNFIEETVPNGDQRGQMHTTQWTMVLTASLEGSTEGSAALDRLCRTYWYPIYAHVRRRGKSPEDAQDLTQDFFARLLGKRYLKLADPERGRFRTFLLTALDHFVTNDWARNSALKRGANQTVSLVEIRDGEERYRHEPLDGASPDKLYQLRWAAALLESVVGQLRAEYVALQKEELFDALKACVWGDELEESYQSLATKLTTSEGALRVAAHRMRERYRTLLREAVAQTVASPQDVEDELRHLVSILRS